MNKEEQNLNDSETPKLGISDVIQRFLYNNWKLILLYIAYFIMFSILHGMLYGLFATLFMMGFFYGLSRS